MGEHCAIMAADWGISRAEQDELAAASHNRLQAAFEAGFYDDLVVPYLGSSVTRTSVPARPSTSSPSSNRYSAAPTGR